MLVGFILGYGYYCYQRFYSAPPIESIDLEEKTANGNDYKHNTKCQYTENGHYIWLYVSEKELKQEWNERSNFPYDSLDKQGQKIKYTLIRYLTSRGFKKDSTGVNKLSEKDISLIEKGYANYIFQYKYSLYPRIYKVIWQIDRYLKGGSANNHSITARIESYKTAMQIISDKPIFGVGTGDIRSTYYTYYEKNNTNIDIIGANQFIKTTVATGLFGLIWFLIALFYPILKEKGQFNFLFITFFIISILSMLNEDTLFYQIGVSFFTFFYSILLFIVYKPGKEEDYKHQHPPAV